MNDLIALSQQYAAQDSQVCDKCNTPLKLRTQIVDARQILVLKLDVWGKVEGGAKMVRRNASINSVSNSSIKVGDKVFTLQSSVHLLSDKSAGFSYISIVRSNGKWIHCNNQVLSHECWPKGAKNLYLAFYEQTSLGGTKQRKYKPEKSQSKFIPPTTKNVPPSKRKCPEKSKPDMGSCAKKIHIESDVPSNIGNGEDWGGIVAVERPVTLQTEWRNYRYFPIDEEWQRQACRLLNLRFVRPFEREPGGQDVILTLPDMDYVRRIRGDGNCLFRALSFIVTGSEHQHFEIRSSIIAHLFNVPELLTGTGADGHQNYLTYYHGGYRSVEDYLTRTGMATNGTWGTDFK